MTQTVTARLGPPQKKEKESVVLDNGLFRLSVSGSGEVVITEVATDVTVRFRSNSYHGGGIRLITSGLIEPVSEGGKIEWSITHR